MDSKLNTKLQVQVNGPYSLFGTCKTVFEVLCPVWAPQYKKDIDILDQVQQV